MSRNMKILVVCSYRNYIIDGIAPFIKEQVEAVGQNGVDCEYFVIKGKGIIGYLKNYWAFIRRIKTYKPDIIHAHYGLCGLFANLQRRVPVVTTYHGSDINNPKARRYAKYAIRWSAWNIFVSTKNMIIAGATDGKKASLIPCGIDDTLFKPMAKKEAREMLAESGKWKTEKGKKYVLFTKMFRDPVKDYPLAKQVIERLNESVAESVELLEFTGYTREQSAILMNAVDAILMTSKTEGSPQVIKEAMACGCPIVSVDVGDVKERIAGIDGCYVIPKDERPKMIDELAEALEKALAYEGKTNGREVLMQQNSSNGLVAKQLIKIYERILN